MQRPCGHSEVNSQQCHICWLYQFRPEYRKLYGGQWTEQDTERPVEESPSRGGAKPRQARALECFHLSDRIIDKLGCDCQGRWIRQCDRHGLCSTVSPNEGVACCETCEDYTAEPPDTEPRKVCLIDRHAPGDSLVFTAALECLHRQHPLKFYTQVDCPAPAIFENNPWVQEGTDWEPVYMEYPGVHESCQRVDHFMNAYVDYLGQALNVPLRLTVNRPYLYFRKEEREDWIPQVQEVTGRRTRYWVINSGVKQDYTAKGWGHERYQKVVDELQGQVFFVQVGEGHHLHRPLDRVLNLIGKTDTRQLLRLCLHAEGGIGGTTFLQHIFAALEKPYVCVLGGREPVQWVQYPKQTTLHSIGALSCCRHFACWKSRTVKLNDGKDDSLCEQPTPGTHPVPRCMAMIDPAEAVLAIRKYLTAGD